MTTMVPVSNVSKLIEAWRDGVSAPDMPASPAGEQFPPPAPMRASHGRPQLRATAEWTTTCTTTMAQQGMPLGA
ncbi:hypothetical protein [Streptosporangium sp. OZ121]|uniref:hypothetical protein n=1 Tax=Streptosporangium sp. OZ121 TaxID=3444183 RepID=UPI003F796656